MELRTSAAVEWKGRAEVGSEFITGVELVAGCGALGKTTGVYFH